ncbi:MAG: hypothetical protein ABI304_05680 [Rudaea sp.]
MPLLHTYSNLKSSILDRHCTRWRSLGAVFGLAAAAALVLVCKVSLAVAATIGPGYSAMWYDPARSGEGLQLEILDTDHALVEWYTYDEKGGQRWLQGVGQIIHDGAGDSIKFPQLYDTHGGHFGPNFNPADVQLKIVGDATLVFGDCNTGTFTYHAYGQSQTLPMQRLTQTMGAGCESINGIPGQPVMDYAGQSGSWYDTSHSGEGFALQWLATGQAIVTWYTYDTQGNQVWLLGVGAEQNGAIVFDQMAITSGAHFGTAFDPASVQKEDWGTLTLQIDCNGGSAHYASKQTAFGTGDLNLTRLTTLAQPSCPTVAPKLSDLYNITWDEIPIEEGTPADPNYLGAQSIANDGTIAGDRNGHLVLWHPDTRTWEDVPRDIASLPADISPDGLSVIATDAITDEPQPIDILIWQRSTGWQPLPGTAVSRSVHDSVSHNFKYVAGTGHDTGGTDRVWIRAIDGAQQMLPTTNNDFTASLPFAVSDDGRTAVGIGLRFPTPDYPLHVAVRWNIDSLATTLTNPDGEELAVASACDANCNIIYGAGLYDYEPNQPHPGEAWYLKDDGEFGYLGALADAPVTARSYACTDATPDGSLVVGTYTAYKYIDYPDSGTSSRMFIWTQATGIVSVRSLVDELGIGDDDWDEIDAVRVSPDGSKILIGGVHIRQQFHVDHFRAIVLNLMPKAASN